MTDIVSIEDIHNIAEILVHHLGNPWHKDDDGRSMASCDEDTYQALERDLLRYCTRLRCQPRMGEHVDEQGYTVPAHRLIEGRHRA